MFFDIILFNAIIYLLTTIFIFYKIRKVNLYVIIWGAYSVVTLMGYYCTVNDIHYTHDENLGYKVDVIPYINAYLTILLLTHPFSKIKSTNYDLSIFDKAYIGYLLKPIGLLYLYQALYNGINAYVISITFGSGEAYYMIHQGESLDVFNGTIWASLMHKISIITQSAESYYVVYYINRIINKKGQLLMNIVLLGFAFLPNILVSVVSGSKGGLFFTAFGFIFYYILFKDYLDSRTKNTIVKIGGILSIILIIYVISITIDRIDASGTVADEESTGSHLASYLGESYPNLGAFYYDQVKQHPYGKRFFPEFFSDNPEKKYEGLGLDGKFNYWEPKTGVPMGLFKTFWGDWYLEFGLFGSILAIFLLYICFKCLCFNSISKLHTLPILHFYFINIIIQGCFTGSGIEGSLKHKIFLATVALSVIAKLIIKKRRIMPKIR